MLGALPNTVNDTIPNAQPSTTTLQQIADKLKLSQYWVNEQLVMGARVARDRRYYDGDHDMPLSKEVQEQLLIKDKNDGMPINMMPSVVDTKADRCIVQAIEGVEDTPDATENGTDKGATSAPNGKPKTAVNASTQWAQEVMDNNDFDVTQGDVHTSTINDADSYVLVEWDPIAKQSTFYHELAWDGQTGMLMVYKSHNINKAYCAIKVWQIDGSDLDVTTRMNVYYEDRVEKFVSTGVAGFTPFLDDDAKGGSNGVFKYEPIDGMPMGIPVFHFRNGGRGNYGISELRNVIPCQNALNRFHYDAIVSAQLTGFPIYKQFGFSRDTDALKPGTIVKIEGDVSKDQVVEFSKLDGSDPTPLIEAINNEKQLIFEISRTPDPGLSSGSGANKSGEYLKQLEVGLIGKVKKFTTHAGSVWEQVFVYAWKLQQAYGTLKPPPYKRFVCRWKDAEIRNATDAVANAVLLDPIWGNEETMRAVSPFYDDLTEDRIQEIITKKNAQAVAQARAMQAQPMPAPTNNPAIKGAKLPPDQARQVNHITPEELAAVGSMHRNMVGSNAA